MTGLRVLDLGEGCSLEFCIVLLSLDLIEYRMRFASPAIGCGAGRDVS